MSKKVLVVGGELFISQELVAEALAGSSTIVAAVAAVAAGAVAEQGTVTLDGLASQVSSIAAAIDDQSASFQILEERFARIETCLNESGHLMMTGLKLGADVSPQTVEQIKQSQREVFSELARQALVDAEKFRLNKDRYLSAESEKVLAEKVVGEIFHQMFMLEEQEEASGLSGLASIGPIRNKLCAVELSRRLDDAIKLSAEKLQSISRAL